VAKNSRDKLPQHTMLFRYMQDSQAWKSLGAIPRAVYLDIAKRYFGTNNGRIGYSIRCAVAELHIGIATAKRALDDLQDRGFIVATKRGSFNVKVRLASEWRLTQYPCNNDLATKDFMTWTPDKNKTRYPQRNRMVAVAEPFGICSGTVASLNTSDGICSGTVKGHLEAPTVSVAEHIYLTRSPLLEEAVSEARPQGSAVASERPIRDLSAVTDPLLQSALTRLEAVASKKMAAAG
jgi:hypothetical protein